MQRGTMIRIGIYALVAVLLAQASFMVWQRWELGAMYAQTSADGPSVEALEGRFPAPEFPEGMEWLNTGGVELPLESLRGKVVLLDFWTYGCINCIHIIPDLKRLEEEYAEELVVIGVHSAKFDHEGVTDNIRRFVQRYELAHPVVNDAGFQIWRSYGANAWPTLVLINPAGNAVGFLSGEGHYEILDQYIGALVEHYDDLGQIDRSPIPLALEYAELDTGALRFPAKVTVDAAGGRLFIADTGHHRVIQTDLDGVVQRVYGTGEPGLVDGAAEQARFEQPRGLALWDQHSLFVADTMNHAIRHIDLRDGSVTTVAGTGEQEFLFERTADPIRQGMRSPWDLLRVGEWLYVAMAGQHQVWRLRPEDLRWEAFAGSLREELTDGYRLDGGMNQPSGLTSDGEFLFVADSEASAVRRIELGEGGAMDTLVGTGLFDFGDRDGVGDEVLLQHPLAVVYDQGGEQGRIILADTYNSKVKVLDVATREVTTLIADGLMEPGGLALADGRLYISDTNQHALRVYDLASGELREVELSFR